MTRIRIRDTEKDYTPCPGCGVRKVPFAGPVCGACVKGAEREQALAKRVRQQAQELRGRIGDESRVKAALGDFDAFSKAVREAAGCPAGGSR